jgi:hypothetical protein
VDAVTGTPTETVVVQETEGHKGAGYVAGIGTKTPSVKIQELALLSMVAGAGIVLPTSRSPDLAR